MPKLITCAKCCTIFSATGLVFLLSLGILLDTQPLYVKGPHDAEAASSNCYGAASLYAASMALSLVYWIYNASTQPTTHVHSSPSTTPKSPQTRVRENSRYDELQVYDDDIY